MSSATGDFLDLCRKVGLPEKQSRSLLVLAELVGISADDPVSSIVLILGLIKSAVSIQEDLLATLPRTLDTAIASVLATTTASARSSSEQAATMAADRVATRLSGQLQRREARHNVQLVSLVAGTAFCIALLTFGCGHFLGGASQIVASGFWTSIPKARQGAWHELIAANGLLPEIFTRCLRSPQRIADGLTYCPLNLNIAEGARPQNWYYSVSNFWSEHAWMVYVSVSFGAGALATWLAPRLLRKIKP